MYTEEDLEASREKGFAAGKEAGLHDAELSDEQRSAAALSLIAERLNDLFRIQEEMNSKISAESTELSIAVLRKLFPQLSRKHALAEIEDLVGKTLGSLTDAHKVKIYVNDVLLQDINRKVSELAETIGHAGSVTVLSEDTVAVGDCRIEWGNGGAERNSERMWREIDAIIERGLNELKPEPSVPEEDSGEDGSSPDAG
ncbi:MAG: FliH/SctL family protein [Rhodospirillales bacterium]|nr:FliH/SctL family protein [Rhodospirillales bacterium]